MTRNVIIDELVPMALMQMKLSAYFINKFQFKNDPEKQYMEKLSAEDLLATILANPCALHKYLPAGTSVSTVTKEDAFESPLFLQSYPGPLRAIIEFMRDFLDERDDLRDAALRVLATNPAASAETLLDSPGIKDCGFELSEVVAETQRLYAPVAPVVPPPEPSPPAAAPSPPIGTFVPEPPTTTEVRSNVDEHFTHLKVSEATMDKFNKIDAHLYDRMRKFAQGKVANTTFIVRPADSAGLKTALARSPLVQTTSPTERILYFYQGCHLDNASDGFNCSAPPTHDSKDYAKVLTTLFGEDKKDESVAVPGIFGHNGSSDVLLTPDGRRPTSAVKIDVENRKAVKWTGDYFAKRPTSILRFMFHNREFTSNPWRHKGKKTRRSLTYGIPDPLENVHVLHSKSSKLNIVPRQYLDLPGANRIRGLNAVPLVPGVADSHPLELDVFVSPSTPTAVLSGLVRSKEQQDHWRWRRNDVDGDRGDDDDGDVGGS